MNASQPIINFQCYTGDKKEEDNLCLIKTHTVHTFILPTVVDIC